MHPGKKGSTKYWSGKVVQNDGCGKVVQGDEDGKVIQDDEMES